MKTSTQVYRELKAAEFSEPQARALVEILQAGGIVEHEPPESELERIEQYLLAEPLQPFVIEMAGGKSYRIERLKLACTNVAHMAGSLTSSLILGH
jgi:hypothetical protein